MWRDALRLYVVDVYVVAWLQKFLEDFRILCCIVMCCKHVPIFIIELRAQYHNIHNPMLHLITVKVLMTGVVVLSDRSQRISFLSQLHMHSSGL